MSWITHTRSDIGLSVERLILGIVFLAHGSQKVLGLFGGAGLFATVASFEQMGLPSFVAWGVPFVEFLGGIGLIAGFLTRLWALLIGAVMVGAITLVHLPNGFFMNWSGTHAGEGFEYHLLALALAFSLLINGGGAFSMDHTRTLDRDRNLNPNS